MFTIVYHFLPKIDILSLQPLSLLTVVLVNGLTGPSVLLVAMVVNNKDIASVIALTQSMMGRIVLVTTVKNKTVTLTFVQVSTCDCYDTFRKS